MADADVHGGRRYQGPRAPRAGTGRTLAVVAPATPLSDAIQHYLREVYKLGESGERVSTTALAREMRVSPASASAMVKKLAALELVSHAPYREVALTPAGSTPWPEESESSPPL